MIEVLGNWRGWPLRGAFFLQFLVACDLDRKMVDGIIISI
jgi:hypothetical protein